MVAIVDDFAQQLAKLLKETFEAGGRFYLEDGAGLFPALDAITPEVASKTPFPWAPSIAAHCAHFDDYVRVRHCWARAEGRLVVELAGSHRWSSRVGGSQERAAEWVRRTHDVIELADGLERRCCLRGPPATEKTPIRPGAPRSRRRRANVAPRGE
jgi:hypothetical protein